MAEKYRGYHGPGIGNVGSYQVSGIPFITGSAALMNGDEDEISFPSVTKSVTVANYSQSPIRFSFASKDTGRVVAGYHFWQLDHAIASGSSNVMTMNVKCDKIYVSNASGDNNLEYRVFAELTGIDSDEMFTLDGPGLTD